MQILLKEAENFWDKNKIDSGSVNKLTELRNQHNSIKSQIQQLDDKYDEIFRDLKQKTEQMEKK